MIPRLKAFFQIRAPYRFEWNDVSALLICFNVLFVILGYAWAPVLGVINNLLGLVLAVRSRAHLNIYLLNAALLVLNIYFLI